jgi:uroporphyrinogen-III synthase
MEEPETSTALRGQVVAVPESRQLDILEELLVRRGASVMRVPLVAILDAPDPAPILLWIDEFIATPADYLIILTGEGLRRLRGVAQRHDREEAFIAALRHTFTVCRGPKPGRALKEVDLKPDLLGKAPTTPGVMEALEELELAGKRVAVQLYGEEPNLLLMDYLLRRGAIASSVAPYVYAPHTHEEKVVEFLHSLARGDVTMMTFTSQPQYTRLVDVAHRHGIEDVLKAGLARVTVAAVGPVVGDQLAAAGVRVSVMPESQFFMKPMVTELVRLVRAQALVAKEVGL